MCFHRVGGGSDSARPLHILVEKATAAMAAAATPVIGVCASCYQATELNLPNPLHQTFTRVGGIFSITNITTGVFCVVFFVLFFFFFSPPSSVMNDVNDDCRVSRLYDAFCRAHYSLRLLSAQHLGLMREEVFIVCATHSLQ